MCKSQGLLEIFIRGVVFRIGCSNICKALKMIRLKEIEAFFHPDQAVVLHRQ
jgi:hypothetical protein